MAETGRVTRRRRTLLWTGIGLLVAGLVVLGYIGWEYVGTNVVAEHRQAQTVDRLQEQWRRLPASEVRPGATATPVDLGDATALVRVPRFGDDYVVPVVEGVDDAALAAGLGHFVGSAAPGGVGNFALAGHRVTHGEPLRDIHSLQPGDVVTVETARSTYTYEIDTDPDDLEVDDHAAWVVEPRPVNPDASGARPADAARLLTLVTCAELFHTDERTVVFGHLVHTEPK
jgi:sortase A